MASSSGGISGLAVSMLTAGSFLVYAGVKDVGLLDGLRSLAQGTLPAGKSSAGAGGWLNTLPTVNGTPGASAGASSGGAAAGIGPQLVSGARQYLGVRYFYGGNWPQDRRGIDCSRLVQLSFQGAGVADAPRTSGGFLAWRKLRRVSGAPAAGDVLYWPGHVALAESATTMIEAPTWGIPVRETTIRPGAIVLRYVAAAASSSTGGTVRAA